MSKTKNLHDVSAFFFFLLAFAYVFAALSFRNDFYEAWMVFGMRLMDLPFALAALLYGGSGLILQIDDGEPESNEAEEKSAYHLAIIAVGILLFGLAVFVNLAFPSRF